MCPLFEGFPAVIYSGLWSLKVFNRLQTHFPKVPLKLVFLIIDSPPAFSVFITENDFEVKVLEDINSPEELKNLECDGYIAFPLELVFRGPAGIINGIQQKKVFIKNNEILSYLATIAGGVI